VIRRVWLVRHGEPAESVGIDPGLTPRGIEQAAALVGVLEPVALRTSPLRRARETAAPLEAAWGAVAVPDPAFRELPSGHADAAARREWLRAALAGTFAELGAEQRAWRDAIVDAVRELADDTVITTHAVVINAVTGHCTGDDSVLAWVPAHTSVTEIHVGGDGQLTLARRGAGRAGGAVV
jgi:broad specificity phosphatase PhoE